MKPFHNIRPLALILLLALSALAPAQNIIRPKIECPNNIYVNAYNGVLFTQRTDMSMPTRGGRLTLAFYYNSIYNTVDYGYGHGWTLGIEMRYILDSTGVTIEQGNGRQDRFARYGSRFVTPAGLFSTLSKNGTTYQLLEKDGTRYIFDDTLSKCATQIIDRNNNAISLVYTGTRLTSISDNAGRTFTFHWTGDRMTQITTSANSAWIWNYRYDANGNLVQATDPDAHSHHYGYDRDNRIATLSDDEGNTTRISYNAHDHFVTRIKTSLTDRAIHYDLINRTTTVVDYMTDEDNQFTAFRWDDKGRITSIEGNHATRISRYEYDNANNIIRQVDGNGRTLAFTYDNNGNLLSATDDLNQTVRYTYGDFARLATFTDQLGHQHQFTHDAHGNITAYRDPLGHVTTYTYNPYGQILSATDPLGNTTAISYDAYGNPASLTDPLSHTLLLDYTPAGLLSSITTPNNGQYTFLFNHQNNLSRFTDPLGNATSLDYDSRGNLQRVANPLGHTYTFRYNDLNQLVCATTPRGDSATTAYNQRLLPSQVTDLMGHASRRLYDHRSRLSAIIDAIGDTTFFNYDGVDNISRIIYPNGRLLRFRYDILNRLACVCDQVDTIEAYTYDAVGRIATFTNEAGHTTAYTYDAAGRTTAVSDGLGHTDTYAYDDADRLISHTDASGHTSAYAYDAAGQLTAFTDPLGNTTTYTYDANGNLASLTDADGNATHFAYNADSRLSQITFANNATRHYAYDAAGRLTAYTDEAGNTITLTYDANGSLIGKNCPGLLATTYSRNALGQITTASTGSHSLTFAYDPLGRLTSESDGSASTHYVYGSDRLSRTISYPGGRTIVEQRDLRGNLATISENNQTLATFSHLADGTPLASSFANGTAASYTYNEADLIAQITATPQVLALQHAYSPAGDLTLRLDALRSDHSERYAYDNARRLTDYRRGTDTGTDIPTPLAHIQYALDAAGNRTAATINGTAATYASNALNQYTQAGTRSLQYDARGNLTFDGTHHYDYDLEKRLIAIDGGTTATYDYDALGRRISKTTAAGTTHYYYDGLNLIEERNDQGATTATYVYANGLDQIVQMRRGTDTYYLHTDALGSVMAATNADGSVVERYAYDPYGTPTFYDASGAPIPQSSIQNRMLFTGREYDAESGLYHYRARAMNPDHGRFLQTDPLLFADNANLYTYVGNMPTRFIDPLGMASTNWAAWAEAAGNAYDAASGGLTMAGSLTGVGGKINDLIGTGRSLYQVATGCADGSIGLGDIYTMATTVLDAGAMIADYKFGISALTISSAMGASAASALTLPGAMAVYSAWKFGTAIGGLIDNLAGDHITNFLWKHFGDKDEDIKATGVHPRFPEPCGNSSKNGDTPKSTDSPKK